MTDIARRPFRDLPRRSWRRRADGYNLIEMMFVMGIMSVLAAMAIVQINASRAALKGDAAMRVVMTTMNQAREMAITQRRYMQVNFAAPRTINVVREDTTTTTTPLSSIPFEGGATFAIYSGLPDTPDAFGKSAAHVLHVERRNGDDRQVRAGRHARGFERPDGKWQRVSLDSQPRPVIARHHGPGFDGPCAGVPVGRQRLESGVAMQMSSESGFSVVETIVSIGVLTTGIIGAAAVLVAGMTNLNSSPADVVVTQKASQAVEAVFAARDSHKLTWSQIRNVRGPSGNDGGVFLDGPQPLKKAGADGLVNTADDTTVETVVLPGKDQMIGTSDDQTLTLNQFQREIAIADVPGENGQLRSITVTITYQNGPTKRTYVLTTFISSYA